jgi:hypothetical protein
MNYIYSGRIHALVPILTLLFVVSDLSAQSPNPSKQADDAWGKVVASFKPPASAPGNTMGVKTAEDKKAEIKAQAARSRQTALDARDFRNAYPAHPKAEEARKIEALASIRSVEAGDALGAQSAMALGKTIRDDEKIANADRFEVALAMDRLDLSLKIKERKAAGRVEDRKKVGDKLQQEFGDLPALQNYYVEVARTADPESAAKIAADVTRSPVAPTEAKAKAKIILDRAALVGRSVPLKLAMVDGGSIDLAEQRDKLTVVIAWSPSEASDLSAVKRFEKSLSKDVQIVYLAMGGSASQVNKAKAAAPLAGTHCHAPAGLLARAANDALKLVGSPFPRVYVLNRAGLLVGFGRVEDLPALVVKAGT